MIMKKLKKVKEDMVWNGIIKSINIAYLSICLSISISFKDTDSNKKLSILVTGIIFSVLIIIALITLPVFVSYFSLKNSELFLEKQREDADSNVR
jgi:formate/nitrite transporter FocA (FNT family)